MTLKTTDGPDIERRLRDLEDRAALQDVVVAYLTAVDRLSDKDRIDRVLTCFTEEAVFDLRGLNLSRFDGHAGIREFFTRRNPDVITHLAHFMTNFCVIRLDDDEADCHAYVMGMWKTRAGLQTAGYVHYELSYLRAGKLWKISSFVEGMLMPQPLA